MCKDGQCGSAKMWSRSTRRLSGCSLVAAPVSGQFFSSRSYDTAFLEVCKDIEVCFMPSSALFLTPIFGTLREGRVDDLCYFVEHWVYRSSKSEQQPGPQRLFRSSCGNCDLPQRLPPAECPDIT